jgi:hypothetical protein
MPNIDPAPRMTAVERILVVLFAVAVAMVLLLPP